MIVIIGVAIALGVILVVNLGQLLTNPTEKTFWFKYTPICCNESSWDKAYVNTVYPESLRIKYYFQDQGITIIQSMTDNYDCLCPALIYGEPMYYSYYFLVATSDENKMSSLDFIKVDTLPSRAHSVDTH